MLMVLRAHLDAVKKRKVSLNVAVFWDIAPFSAYVKQRSGGKYHLHLQGRKSAE
jgi:hypothetical protein